MTRDEKLVLMYLLGAGHVDHFWWAPTSISIGPAAYKKALSRLIRKGYVDVRRFGNSTHKRNIHTLSNTGSKLAVSTILTEPPVRKYGYNYNRRGNKPDSLIKRTTDRYGYEQYGD